MFLESYNNNSYLRLLSKSLAILSEVNTFLERILQCEEYDRIEKLQEIYSSAFSNNEYFDFSINKIFKSTIFGYTHLNHTQGNSYYHLRLKLRGDDIQWLDDLYGGYLSRILKLLTSTFSKIDDLSIEFNERKIKKYKNIVDEVKEELDLFLNYHSHREIVERRNKLVKEKLALLPHGGLFYLASIENLASILSNGIISHKLAHGKQLIKVDISNTQVNNLRNREEPIHKRNIQDYVPLYINPKNPMQYVLSKNGLRSKLIIIKVNPNVLVNEDAIFSDGNAASHKTKFYKSVEDFNKLNWICINDIYWTNHTDGKRFRCSEVLVYKRIGQEYFEEINIFDGNLLDMVLKSFPNHYGVNVCINKKLFF